MYADSVNERLTLPMNELVIKDTRVLVKVRWSHMLRDSPVE